MHYYKKNIGDYAKKAGRLSMLQHGAYTLLIDSCYDRERFPTLEEALEWTWASTTEETEAVTFVLRKFFDLENGVYVQNRIRDEIEQYHLNSATNARIASEREAKRKENSTNRVPNVNEPPPNHKPITNNHNKDIAPSAKKYSMRQDLIERGVSEQIAKDWLEVRKTKKLAGTLTALEAIAKEVSAAGLELESALKICCERGWGGFKAKWLLNDPSSNSNNKPWER